MYKFVFFSSLKNKKVKISDCSDIFWISAKFQFFWNASFPNIEYTLSRQIFVHQPLDNSQNPRKIPVLSCSFKNVLPLPRLDHHESSDPTASNNLQQIPTIFGQWRPSTARIWAIHQKRRHRGGVRKIRDDKCRNLCGNKRREPRNIHQQTAFKVDRKLRASWR